MRLLAVATAAVLLLTACSTPTAPPPSPPSATVGSSAPPSPSQSPSPSPSSAFCLNLTLLQVGVSLYRAGAGKARRGQPLDLEELHRQSVIIARTGKPMRADAPADIKEQLDDVLAAIAASAKHLKDGASTKALLTPLYGPDIRAAFDAVDTYTCPK